MLISRFDMHLMEEDCEMLRAVFHGKLQRQVLQPVDLVSLQLFCWGYFEDDPGCVLVVKRLCDILASAIFLDLQRCADFWNLRKQF